jgi:hypothetical protein
MCSLNFAYGGNRLAYHIWRIQSFSSCARIKRWDSVNNSRLNQSTVNPEGIGQPEGGWWGKGLAILSFVLEQVYTLVIQRVTDGNMTIEIQ